MANLMFYNSLIITWVNASRLAYPQVSKLTLTSSTCDSGELVWSQVPALAQGLPPLASLLHWYLQQPVSTWPQVGGELYLMASLREQLAVMLKGAAEVRWGWQIWQGGSSQQQQQQQQQTSQQQAGPEGTSHASTSSNHLDAGQELDILTQTGVRQQVRAMYTAFVQF
jgi:hypothetical protein